jgi:hypothetical protein
MENSMNKEMNEEMYDPDAFFCIDGSTALHINAD